jgi:predicted Fe-Mo cluster-binding NifX family protein
MERRENVLKQLRQMGFRAITTSPERLVQQAVKAYLEIKLQGTI